MSEEQTPSAQPTQNVRISNPGDYFYRGGKLYVFELKLGAGGDGVNLEKTWVDKGFVLATPNELGKVGAKTMVPPVSGISGAAEGYDIVTQVEDNIYEQNYGRGSISLRNYAPVARPAEGPGTLRYPMSGDDQGGIAEDGDYVLFQFYDYAPPFGKTREATNELGGGGSKFDYNQVGEYTESTGYKPIMLYMPEDISSGFKAKWEGKSMSTLGADAIRSLGQEGIGKVSAGVQTLTRLVEKMKPLAGAAAVQASLGKLTGDNLSYDDIFGGISGAILNPNTELLYNGIDMRTFNLSFKLFPRHEAESSQINNICNQFKRATLPSKSPAGNVLGSSNDSIDLGFIGVPKLCKVSFMKGSGMNNRLPRYKMCGITSVNVNYTPDGTYATYKDGQPVAVGLELGFQETKICFAEEIDNNVR